MVLGVLDAPEYCQYEGGRCSRIKNKLELKNVFFAYPNRPTNISSQISQAVTKIRQQKGCSVIDWRELQIEGKIIFCEICRAIRQSEVLCVDITTLNENVIFELGFAVGLGKTIWPIKDTTYEKDHKAFNKMRLLEILGFSDFRNSDEIMSKFLLKKPWEVSQDETINHFHFETSITRSSRLFYYKSSHSNDGSIQLTSLIKKSRIPTTVIDPRENPQLSLREYSKNIADSLGVVVHLMSPDRSESNVHNAVCALLAGVGLALSKPVLILQEGEVLRPIDFGEIIRNYTIAKNIPIFFEKWLVAVRENYTKSKRCQSLKPSRASLLESVNLGGTFAAENEIDQLKKCFVETNIYRHLLREKDPTIVSGRRGTGKTALFYEVRRKYWERRSFLVLDLKPEGYQLKLFADVLEQHFSQGTAHYLIKSFWEYVLLSEMGRKILRDDAYAYQDPDILKVYKEVERNINPFNICWEGDFAQRLLDLVNNIQLKFEELDASSTPAEITQHLYKNAIPSLRAAIVNFLKYKDGVVILIDNLDKDWKPYEDIDIEVCILRTLIDSLRTFSRQLVKNKIENLSVVFIRNDILTLLNKKTPDKGKDNVIDLKWTDKETLSYVLIERLEELSDSQAIKWGDIFSRMCKGIDSYSYIVDRTLMRPRDLLSFCKKAIEVAIERKHEIVEEADIRHAEKNYSSSALDALVEEIRDVYGDMEGCVIEFLDETLPIDEKRLRELLEDGFGGVVEDKDYHVVVDLLLEYGFLGMQTGTNEFSYVIDGDSNVLKIKKRAQKFSKKMTAPQMFTIHPTFRMGLGIVD